MNAECEPSKATLMSGLDRSPLPAALVKAFLLTSVLVLVNRAGLFVAPGWLNAVLVVFGLSAVVGSFAPVIAWPNAFIAAVMAAGTGGMAEAASAALGFPLGGREFQSGNGPMILGLLPWWLPIAWGTVALSARGTARLVLYRMREHPLHGYRVISLAAVLAGVAFLSLEHFATRSAHLWERGGMSVANHASLFLLHLVIQIGITPMLIDKFPGRRPPNFLPLWGWGAMMILLAAGIIESAITR